MQLALVMITYMSVATRPEPLAICITLHTVFKQFTKNQQLIMRNILHKMGQLVKL